MCTDFTSLLLRTLSPLQTCLCQTRKEKKNIDVYIVSISIKILIKLALNSTLSLLCFCRPVININIVVFKQIFRLESTELSDGFFSYFFLSVYLYSYNSLIISNLTQSILLFVKMKDNGSSMWEGWGGHGYQKKMKIGQVFENFHKIYLNIKKLFLMRFLFYDRFKLY